MTIMPDSNEPSAPLQDLLLKEAYGKIPFWSTTYAITRITRTPASRAAERQKTEP
jgi:hypothetical protein